MRLYGCDKGSYDDGWQVCYYFLDYILVNICIVTRWVTSMG